ncbi:hypothetical protein ABPG74_020665 [Tetrahymena malaccensis]
MAYSIKQILQNKIFTQTTIHFHLSFKTQYLLYHIYQKKNYVDIKNVDFNDETFFDLALNYMFQSLEEKIQLSQNANTICFWIADKQNIWNNEEHSLGKLVSNSKRLKSVILEFLNYQYPKKYYADNPSTLCHYAIVMSQFKEIENLTIFFQRDILDDKNIALLFNNMSELQNLTRLNIDLRENCFGQQGIEILSEKISQIQNLCCLNLNLYKIKIKNEGAIKLASNLAKCLNLREIGINNSYNEISKEAIYPYIDMLSKNTCLESLNLNFYDNKIGSQEIDIFPKQLANLISLSLNLRYTEIGDRGLNCLSQILNQSQTIQNLCLTFYNCNFNDEAIKDFSQSIQTCQKLSKLQLFFSSLATGNWTIGYLVSSISQCLDLKHLSLYFHSCKIQDERLLVIGEQLQLLKNLSILQLDLDKNKFKDQALQKFGKIISQMKQLKILQISVRFTPCHQSLNFVQEINISSLNHLILGLPQVHQVKDKKKVLGYLKRINKRLVFLYVKMY